MSLRPRQPETLVGQISGDDKPYPANPNESVGCVALGTAGTPEEGPGCVDTKIVRFPEQRSQWCDWGDDP